MLDERPAIRQLAACFDAALFAQALQTAFCNASHLVNARLARLLLEAQDHNGGLAEVRLTHADFAQILGVRRTTITLVVGQLEATGAIRSRRGFVEILKSDLLKTALL
jgi:CRP-like cAMP-binding protein